MPKAKERGSAEGGASPQGVIHPNPERETPRGGCKRRPGLRLAQAWLTPRDYAHALTIGNGNVSAGIRHAIEASREPRDSFNADRWARALAPDYAPRLRNPPTFGQDMEWVRAKTNLPEKDAREIVARLRSPT